MPGITIVFQFKRKREKALIFFTLVGPRDCRVVRNINIIIFFCQLYSKENDISLL